MILHPQIRAHSVPSSVQYSGFPGIPGHVVQCIAVHQAQQVLVKVRAFSHLNSISALNSTSQLTVLSSAVPPAVSPDPSHTGDIEAL